MELVLLQISICVITDHVRCTREGNVFSRVCDSVRGGGGGGQGDPTTFPWTG